MILIVFLCLDWVIKKPNQQNKFEPSTFLQNHKSVQTGRFFMMQLSFLSQQEQLCLCSS